MPIHACRCEGCGAEFDYLSMGASDRPACPECRSLKVVRLLAPFAVGAAAAAPVESCACPGGPSACPHPCPRALAGA